MDFLELLCFLITVFQVEAPVSAPAYERIRDAAATASSPSPPGAISQRLYSPAPAALTTTVSGQSTAPGGSQVSCWFLVVDVVKPSPVHSGIVGGGLNPLTLTVAIWLQL